VPGGIHTKGVTTGNHPALVGMCPRNHERKGS
jgi:hypothetical protein